ALYERFYMGEFIRLRLRSNPFLYAQLWRVYIHTDKEGSYTLQTSIMSNDIAILRAVCVTAP
ncbi:MAG TPA: hypothetical protein PKW79_01965, partial [Rhabdochlamydiaceae bacterium]|nr:hypothetical protein [Rhabdochlamydiaceae bacterium]